MIRFLTVTGVVLIGVIWAIGSYLQPDDLAKCRMPTDSGSCRKAGAIIVVSGGDTAARTDEAIRLFGDNWAPYLIMSGAAADKSGPSNAAAMRRQAVAAGVPQSAIMVDEQSETTQQNAVEVRQLLAHHHITDVVLVTSGYHMRRAQLEFSSRLPGVAVRSHPVATDSHWRKLWWLTPVGWWLAGGELIRISLFAMGVSR